MKKTTKNNHSSATDKAIAKPGTVKRKKLKTDEPLSEKDEVKLAEEEMRKQSKK